MGVMMNPGNIDPPQSRFVICPRCSSAVTKDELRKCEWCEEVGCSHCQDTVIDGVVCDKDECGVRLKQYQDNLERKWDERIARRHYE